MAPKGLLLASSRDDDDSDEGNDVESERDCDERIDADADVHVCVWLLVPLQAKLVGPNVCSLACVQTCYQHGSETP